ncbi:hypothetical protein [Marinobacterium lutimaris]|uniref:Uncharacterized protein n=1 Tax=Marinobacterium lutimaris TaxID=568106 RepID=A0A1H5XVM9_9GAMM|nr:hypothetical protein [Marinobacterium lutimaris]SEG15751.1 hypothetical protein SAMN05444390_1011520 [Marinobacterium lutimaris]
MSRYMEFFYLDSTNAARYTGIGAAFKTDSETTNAFDSYKALEVDPKEAQFALDLYEENGDIAATLFLATETFEALSNSACLSEELYIANDAAYWQRQQRETV